MSRISFSLALFATLAFAFGVVGCNSKAPNTKSTPSTGKSSNKQNEQADDTQSDMEKMKAELAKLSPEDAASAEKQHFCPVSGEMLGVMGAPQKVDVNGQQVWICCAECKDKLLANPDEYLAKLKNE